MDMTLIVFLAAGILFAIINFHLGYLMVKKHGSFKYGTLNWGIAIFLGFTVIEKFLSI